MYVYMYILYNYLIIFIYFILYIIYYVYMYLNFLYVVDWKNIKEKLFKRFTNNIFKKHRNRWKFIFLIVSYFYFSNQWWESNRIIREKYSVFVIKTLVLIFIFIFIKISRFFLIQSKQFCLIHYTNRFNGKFVNI